MRKIVFSATQAPTGWVEAFLRASVWRRRCASGVGQGFLKRGNITNKEKMKEENFCQSKKALAMADLEAAYARARRWDSMTAAIEESYRRAERDREGRESYERHYGWLERIRSQHPIGPPPVFDTLPPDWPRPWLKNPWS